MAKFSREINNEIVDIIFYENEWNLEALIACIHRWCSKQSATDPYNESDESSPLGHTLFL
jgi:hypothetical protein